ncbi:MAG: exodeoxyribonuclease III [Rhodospirillales bacterium]|nr:exodeoxyribonuclease III [Rhodospirillales bacterium]
MRIATWNVNSVRQRMGHLQRFVAERSPDVICLQETKVADALFPKEALIALGYSHLEIHGQKSYNGVAIASRLPFGQVERKVFCGLDDRRHLSVLLPGGLELHNFYVPSGGPDPDREKNPKFAHKLDFLAEMAAWAAAGKLAGRQALLVGDLNVAPLENDVWNHKRLIKSVGHTPAESAAMAKLRAAGRFEDIPRRYTPEPAPLYSWWGYRYPQSYRKDYGWRLDHALATPPLAGQVTALETFRDTRSWEKPSDHVPVIVDLA